MELKEAIRKRRSHRNYSGKPVAVEVVNKLLELANLAPSANNLKNRNFIIIKDPKVKEKIFEVGFKQSHLLEAPVVIAFTTNTHLLEPKKFLEGCEAWGTNLFGATSENYASNKEFMENWQKWMELWPIEDVSASIMIFMLAAVQENLATCWIGLFDHQLVKKILKLPDNQEVVALVTLGYPKEAIPSQKIRKPIKDLLRFL